MFKNLLHHIDLFGVTIGLNFLGRERVKSRLGGFCTLLYYGFAIWALYTASKDMFSKSNPKSIYSQSYTEDPDDQIISAESFPFAIMVRQFDETAFYNESIYTLKVSQFILQRVIHENGTRESRQTSIDILTESCTLDHFGERAPLFTNIVEQGAICISRKQPELDKITIKGNYDFSQSFKSITVQILKCDQSNPQVSCASETQINDNLSQSYMVIYYANLVMTPQNYSYPDSRFTDNYYKLLSSTEYQETIIGLEPIEVKSDVGWLSESIETHKYIKVNKIMESSQSLASSSLITNTISLELVKLKSEYVRTYKKIQEVLAEAGGITSYVIIIIGIITSPYLNFKYQESLLNELFVATQESKQNRKGVNRKDKRKVRPIKQDNKQKSETTRSINKDSLDDSRSEQIISKKHTINKDSCIVRKRENPTVKSRPIQNQESEVSSPTSFPIMDLSASRGSPIDSAEKDKINCITHTMSLSSLSENREKEIFMKNKILRPRKVSKDGTPNIPTFGLDDNDYNEKSKQQRDQIIEENGDILNESKLDKDHTQSLRKNSLLSKEKMENDNEFLQLKTNEKCLNGDKEYVENPEIEISNKEEAVFKQDIFYKKTEISFLEYWCSVIYKTQSVKEKFKLVEEGIKYIETHLDIRHIVKQLGEIERLKSLLLDSDQLVLFENFPKLQINKLASSFNEKKQSKEFPTSLEKINSRDRLLRAFEIIKQKENKNEIDTKLLMLFDHIFKV